MRPAFCIGVCSQELAHGAWRLWHPQELYVVSWISLVNRSAEDGSSVEGGHALFDLLGRIVRSGQGHIEVGLGGDFLKGAGGVHRRRGGGAHKRRRLLHDGTHLGGNIYDMSGLNELDQTLEGVAKTL